MADPFHPQKGPYIRDFKPDQRFIGYYMIRSKQLEPFRDPTRGMFLSLVLGDRTGQIPGRVWEDAEKAAESVERGQVIKVEGEVELYQDRVQARILRLRPAQPGEFDPRDFVPSSERDPEALLAELERYRLNVQNPALRVLLDTFYTDQAFLDRFRLAPSARRVHHAYLGGLLEQTVDLLTLAKTVLQVYPQLDSDLLYTGILLYDIGKVREFSWDTDINYTDEGQLVGHIVLTYEMVSQAIRSIPEFPAELELRLRHMLVSHHGRYEWGSPRRPQTLEAIALHHLENLNTQINRFQGIIERRPPGETWTPYDRLLGRQLYAGPEEDWDDGEDGLPE